MDGVVEETILDADGAVDPAAVAALIDDIGAAAENARESFVPPSEPPDLERATRLLREGAGRAIGLYVLLRTGDRYYRFSRGEHDRLELALQTYLELYAGCYGQDIAADVTLRTAAETLLETEDVVDAAAVLTGVPDRTG